MGLNVGELFVSLGIKGSEKTIGALGETQKGMSGLRSLSVETKAAMVGVFYAVEQLISASAKYGTGLVNFGATFDFPIKKLQQYEYAARQVGIGTEEVRGSIASVQSAMTRMLMGEGAPKGLAMIAQATKNFDVNRVRDTAYVMTQLQEAALKLPKDLGNEALKSFGLSMGTIAAMRRDAFKESILNAAPSYSDKDANALDRVNAKFANLGNKIERAFGKFTIKHGSELVQDLDRVTTAVIKLADSFATLSEKTGVFTKISQAVEGVANTLKLAAEIIDKLSGKDAKKGDLLFDSGEAIPGLKDSPVGKFFRDLLSMANFGVNGVNLPGPAMSIPLPAYAGERGAPGGVTQQVTVKQDLHFNHDGKDSHRTATDVKKAVQDTYRQMSAQGQGS